MPVAGLGTRLLPATKSQPKEVLPVGRKPVVQYVVEELTRVRMKRFLFITGPGKTSIENHFDLNPELIQLLHETGKEDLLAEFGYERTPAQYFYTRQRQLLGLGQAVSCAIIVATLRCLIEFYDVVIPLEAQPSFVLSIEREELGIAAGLQDRVIQVYEGPVSMDFDRAREHDVHGFKCYHYKPLDPALLPAIYLAYHDALSEPTEVFHNDIRARFDRGEEKVVNAMKHFVELAAATREALIDHDANRLGRLMDENFDTRRSLYNLPPWQVQMIETARRCGASAKFAGSGGAIIGTYRDEAMFELLSRALGAMHSRAIKLQVVPNEG